MRDYGKVAPTFWTGETGRHLRDLGRDEQLLALFLVTAPCANMIGLYHLPLPTIAHYLKWDMDSVRLALQRVMSTGYCHYDFERELVWVPAMAAHQIDETLHPRDKRVKFVRHAWEAFRKSPFYRDFHSRYQGAFHLPPLPDAGQQQQTFAGVETTDLDSLLDDIEPKLPEVLDTEAFRAAWEEWLGYRRERRLAKPKGIGLTRAWNRLAKWGEARAIAAIHHSITQGWQGIFEPKEHEHKQSSASVRCNRIRAEEGKYTPHQKGSAGADAAESSTILAETQATPGAPGAPRVADDNRTADPW